VLTLTAPGSTPGLGAILAAIGRDPSLWESTGLPARDERYHAQRLATALDGDTH
jgi:hypothetical protein